MDDGDVTKVFDDHRQEYIDEYEADSYDDESENEEHSDLVNRACGTRSDRTVRALCVSTCDGK